MLAAGLAVICVLGFVASARAETLVVATATDAGPGSLRAAIGDASSGDLVTFDSALNGQTIALTSGAIGVNKSLTIEGPGASQVEIDAEHNSQIFTINDGNVSISGLTLERGAASEVGGAIEKTGSGSLTVSGCTFSHNTAGGAGGIAIESNLGHGGAIYVSGSSGPTTISASTFSANAAGGTGGTGEESGLGSGGAIWGAGESLAVSGSIFNDNTAGGKGGSGDRSGNGAGGAIQKSGGLSLTVSDSDFSGNSAGGDGGGGSRSGRAYGGAVYVSQPSGEQPSLEVTDSSFSNNSVGGTGGDGAASGSGSGGAIEYFSEGPFAVSGSTFDGNSAGGAGGIGGIDSFFSFLGSGSGQGGAISVAGMASSASIADSVFIGNIAGGDGGSGNLSGRGEGGAFWGASGMGPLAVSDSTFGHNVTGGRRGTGGGSGAGVGGAIESFGSLTVTASTFTANAAGGQGGNGEGGFGIGGAIRNFSNKEPLTVSASTFVGNTAGGRGGHGSGGAIDASSVAGREGYIVDTTLTGNEAGGGATGNGGAIAVTGMSMTLASATVSGNTVGSGGSGAGIDSAANEPGQEAAVAANATIISGNTGATNCDAPVASSSYSLEGPSPADLSCGFDLASANPLLDPLADNGGPTETQALPPSSPAVDAVPVINCPTEVDQRGEPRPDNRKSVCDVGAFELQDAPVAPAITSAASSTFQVGRAQSFTITATGLPTPSLSLTGPLPEGLTFTDNGDGTASLSGSPVAGAGGSYSLKIMAANGALPDAEQSFALTVQAPPTASIAIPIDGATYKQGQSVGSSFTCVDGAGGPGISTCVDHAGHLSGSPLDTTAPGRHILTVVARSKDGLASTQSVAYDVVARATPSVPRRPRLLVSYRRRGGIGDPHPSVFVFANRLVRVRLGDCGSHFELRHRAWSRLRAALKGAHIRTNAGNYPAPSGTADLVTHVVDAQGGVVRIALPQRGHQAVRRDLRPLLKALGRLASKGERRMAASCRRSGVITAVHPWAER